MPTNCSPTARISELAEIEESSIGTEFALGSGSTIDSFVKVKMAGGTGHICIGENTTINSGCVLYSGNGITVGNHVAIAANCTFAPTNHEFGNREIPITRQEFQPSRGGIVVEDDVWIGAGCVLLDGAILRRGCVIGAMSLVRGEIPEYSVQCGNPLRLIGWRK
jgi:virginiamycin A acetyltransferase